MPRKTREETYCGQEATTRRETLIDDEKCAEQIRSFDERTLFFVERETKGSEERKRTLLFRYTRWALLDAPLGRLMFVLQPSLLRCGADGSQMCVSFQSPAMRVGQLGRYSRPATQTTVASFVRDLCSENETARGSETMEPPYHCHRRRLRI